MRKRQSSQRDHPNEERSGENAVNGL